MKIEDRREEKDGSVGLYNLPAGKCFMYNKNGDADTDHVYLKTGRVGGREDCLYAVGCVSLNTGSFFWASSTEDVYPVEARVIVEGEK
jgi:hypothetical protein